jgi:hypothetical protein
MIDPKDFWVTEEQVKAHLARAKDGKKKSRLRKETKVGFLKLTSPFCISSSTIKPDVRPGRWSALSKKLGSRPEFIPNTQIPSLCLPLMPRNGA